MSREEHARCLKRELRLNPWKYSVRKVTRKIFECEQKIFQVREISSLELILVSLMVVLPSIVYGLILLKLPDAKYKVPFQSQV